MIDKPPPTQSCSTAEYSRQYRVYWTRLVEEGLVEIEKLAKKISENRGGLFLSSVESKALLDYAKFQDLQSLLDSISADDAKILGFDR